MINLHTHTKLFSRLPDHPYIYISGSRVNWDQMLIFLDVCAFIYVGILVHLHISCISFLFNISFILFYFKVTQSLINENYCAEDKDMS